MKSIEKYVWVASLIGVVTLIYLQLSYLEPRLDRLNSQLGSEVEAKFDKAIFDMYISMFVGYLDHIVFSVWLFVAAKSESLSKAAWCLFGLAFGVSGVICFYAASIYFQLKALRKRPKSSA